MKCRRSVDKTAVYSFYNNRTSNDDGGDKFDISRSCNNLFVLLEHLYLAD